MWCIALLTRLIPVLHCATVIGSLVLPNRFTAATLSAVLPQCGNTYHAPSMRHASGASLCLQACPCSALRLWHEHCHIVQLFRCGKAKLSSRFTAATLNCPLHCRNSSCTVPVAEHLVFVLECVPQAPPGLQQTPPGSDCDPSLGLWGARGDKGENACSLLGTT